MHAYLYEPREERREGLLKELGNADIEVDEIGDEFFSRDLTLLSGDSRSTRSFILAATEQLIQQIMFLRSAGCENPRAKAKIETPKTSRFSPCHQPPTGLSYAL